MTKTTRLWSSETGSHLCKLSSTLLPLGNPPPPPGCKTWSSPFFRDWPRLSLKALCQPSSPAPLHVPCFPFVNSASAARQSALPHTRSFLPRAISSVYTKLIFPLCPNTQLTMGSLPGPECRLGLAAPA